MDLKPHRFSILFFHIMVSIGLGQNYSLFFEAGDHVAIDNQSIEEITGSSWSYQKSISAWIIPSGQSTNVSDGWSGQQIYGQNQMGFGFGNTHGISRGIIDGQDKIWVYNWDGNDDRIGIDYEIGELMHVALVHDDGILYAYKNGVLVDQVNSNPTADGGFIRIGGGTENGNAFNGHIDEVRVWSIARSAEDIFDQMYLQLNGEEQGLVGYWNFNEGEGLFAYDLSDNQNHGDIIGADYSTETFNPCEDDEIVLWSYCLSVESTTELNLSSHQIQGQIPDNIGDLTNLTSLVLSNNDLTGPIPPEIGNLAELEILDLSGNALTGSIPSEISELSQLSVLNLYFNDLGGELPEFLQYMTNLRHIDLAGNQLTGPIDNAIIENADSLVYMNLSFNLLSDVIPLSIGALDDLRYLFLNNNSISGELPIELFQLNNLRYLWLSSNQIEGYIPSEIMELTSLQQLFMSHNNLSGLIPNGICDLSVDWDGQEDIGLTNFNISNNGLCPPFPSCLEGVVGYQDTSNCSGMMNIYESDPVLNGFTLYDAFPNPFNPVISLSYGIHITQMVEVLIYDISGRPVKSLVSELQSPGSKMVQWDGTNDRGLALPSGTYFFTIRSGDRYDSRKIIMLK